MTATYAQTPQGYTATATAYDAMGRPWRGYAPAPVDGVDIGIAEIYAASASFHDDGHPYTETSYEPSPSAIAIATAKAGDTWHDAGKAARRCILANDGDTYRCPRYVIEGDGVRLNGNYAPGQLEVTEDIDEDGVTVRTYKDFLGRTIRRTTGTGGGAAATDYVYDGYGDLRYILPPGLEGTHSRTDDVMKNWPIGTTMMDEDCLYQRNCPARLSPSIVTIRQGASLPNETDASWATPGICLPMTAAGGRWRSIAAA